MDEHELPLTALRDGHRLGTVATGVTGGSDHRGATTGPLAERLGASAVRER
jgi:hypothetical protein